MKRLFLLIGLALLPIVTRAQNVSLQTNCLDYANLGTVNAELGVAIAQHWSLNADVRYNNWGFGEGTPEKPWFQNKRQCYSFGARYWYWNKFAGWWTSVKFRYQEYNRGGMFKNPETEEGDAFGFAISAGYSYLVNSHLNFDFGAGCYPAYSLYRKYDCPRCGLPLNANNDRYGKFLFSPYDIELFFSIVFIL